MAIERIEIRRIIHRTDTIANWELHNPVLAEGEFGIEKETRQFKLGDGVTPWLTLEHGGIQGPPGPTGFISADANNRLVHGTDDGLLVPELTLDILAIYNATLNN